MLALIPAGGCRWVAPPQCQPLLGCCAGSDVGQQRMAAEVAQAGDVGRRDRAGPLQGAAQGQRLQLALQPERARHCCWLSCLGAGGGRLPLLRLLLLLLLLPDKQGLQIRCLARLCRTAACWSAGGSAAAGRLGGGPLDVLLPALWSHQRASDGSQHGCRLQLLPPLRLLLLRGAVRLGRPAVIQQQLAQAAQQRRVQQRLAMRDAEHVGGHR